MTPEQLIIGRDLGVNVRGRELIRHIDLEVLRRRILTLIGPNGAGKTTLVRHALGLLPPTAGTIPRAPGLRVGCMPQRLSLPESMPLSVRRLLALTHPDSASLLENARQVGVSHLLDRPMQGLSGGETQRVLLTRALLGDPDLLVLDEPAQGIDVNGQAEPIG
jgi:zinc transport system ATP-binding protein